MSDDRPALAESYSWGRSAVKGLWSFLQAVVAALLTLAGAVAVDPELAQGLREVFKDHPGALMAIGGLAFAGRVLQDWRKHR